MFCERDLHGCKATPATGSAVSEKCVYAAYTFMTIENAMRSFTMPASFDFIANGPQRGSQVSKKKRESELPRRKSSNSNDFKENQRGKQFFIFLFFLVFSAAACGPVLEPVLRPFVCLINAQHCKHPENATRRSTSNANKAAGSNIIKSKWQQHQSSRRRQRKLQQSSTTHTQTQPRAIEVCVCVCVPRPEKSIKLWNFYGTHSSHLFLLHAAALHGRVGKGAEATNVFTSFPVLLTFPIYHRTDGSRL